MNGIELTNAINILSRLPGLGPRSARRLMLHLLKKRSEVLRPMIEALKDMDTAIKTCETCFSFDTISPCQLCCDEKRSNQILCVVSDISDVWALERSQTFYGRYHVLGGVLSAVEGVSPEHLTITSLLKRLQNYQFDEVILALNATVEGQTTLYYLVDLIKPFVSKVSTLAHGVPVGGELDYLDEGTLHTALTGRRILDAA